MKQARSLAKLLKLKLLTKLLTKKLLTGQKMWKVLLAVAALQVVALEVAVLRLKMTAQVAATTIRMQKTHLVAAAVVNL
jgi:predicted lysophospholipase L1 biosynthesis ABC-type transport system permease subunit